MKKITFFVCLIIVLFCGCEDKSLIGDSEPKIENQRLDKKITETLDGNNELENNDNLEEDNSEIYSENLEIQKWLENGAYSRKEVIEHFEYMSSTYSEDKYIKALDKINKDDDVDWIRQANRRVEELLPVIHDAYAMKTLLKMEGYEEEEIADACYTYMIGI